MKTNLSDFLNNREMQELAKNVKFFRELDHMSIEELAVNGKIKIQNLAN